MKKAKCQKLHFKKRIRERYGENFSEQDIKNIIRLIQEDKATLIETQSNRVSKFKVIYKNVEIDVCYDKNRKTLITALPKEI